MRKKSFVLFVFLLASWFCVPVVQALNLDNGVNIRGYFESNNVFRSTDFNSHTDWILNRNTFQLEYNVELLKNTFFLDDLTLSGVFRAWYDGAYDYGNAQKPDGVPGDADLGIREHVDFRELNLVGNSGKLWFKLGRQQIGWGKSDFFRLADIINPVDLSYHFIFEDFQDYRIPKWMGNVIYRAGDIGPLRDVNFELVVNPGDVAVTNLGRFPMPWALAPPGFELIPKDLPKQWTSEAFEVGERIEFGAGPTKWALNHFFGLKQDATFNFATGHLVYPRQNTYGASFDYMNDATGIVLRTEATYVPNKVMGVDASRPVGIALLVQHPDGILKKNEVKYVIGLDRPTWIKFLNPDATFFLTAQVFMTHVLNHEDGITNDGSPVKALDPVYTFVINTTYLNGTVTPQAFAAYRGEGDGLIVGGSINHAIGDHFSYKIGFNSISGRPGTYTGFGGLRDNDEFYARLRYTF